MRTTAEPRPPLLHGILLVDKPAGLTSAAVVARVKRTLGQPKVGHLGTLDPFATGLLPICLGEGTKIAQFLVADEKRYVGEIALGVTTDTLDATGAVVETRPVPPLAPRAIGDAVATLRGDILQTPPMYSALKRGGVPLYRLARAGHEVERAPRAVHVARFDVALTAPDRLAFAVTCSKGTYVRSLAHDLGATLGVGAHLVTLRRTGFGAFALDARRSTRSARRGGGGRDAAVALAVGGAGRVARRRRRRVDDRRHPPRTTARAARARCSTSRRRGGAHRELERRLDRGGGSG